MGVGKSSTVLSAREAYSAFRDFILLRGLEEGEDVTLHETHYVICGDHDRREEEVQRPNTCPVCGGFAVREEELFNFNRKRKSESDE